MGWNGRTPGMVVPLLVCLACSQVRGSGPRWAARSGDAVATAGLAAEEEALLLLLSDRRIYEPLVVDAARRGDGGVRQRLALTLARLADPRGLDVLVELLEDEEISVRRLAAFALGEVGAAAGRAPLLAGLRDESEAVGGESVAALARLGAPLAEVTAALAAMDETQLWRRLLPHLHRFPVAGREGVESLGLELTDSEQRAWAAYAFLAARRPGSAPRVRQLLADPDPRIQTWAARALRELGGRGDDERLLPLLDSASSSVVLAALAAARSLVVSGRLAPSAAWRQKLLRLADDERRPVRVEALATSGAWLLDDELGARLVAAASDGGALRSRERQVALEALAAARHPEAEELLANVAAAADPGLRRSAVRGAALLGARRLLESLCADREAQVRASCLDAELSVVDSPGDRRLSLQRALADPAPIVRLQALRWLEEWPALTVEELATALEVGSRPALARASAAAAFAARAAAEPAERERALEALELLARDRLFVVRQQASFQLAALDAPAPAPGPVRTGRSAAVYGEILSRAARPRFVRLITRLGTIEVRLECPLAPIACVNLLQLAAQGFYDDVEVHRLEPGELLYTGLDAEGGGPGYFLRDEVSTLRFDRAGVLGLARQVPDGGSSELVFTLSPQPGLEARATPLGTVTGGLDVLENLVQGDRVETISEVIR